MKSKNGRVERLEKTKVPPMLYALAFVLIAFVFSQCNESSSASESTEDIVPISGNITGNNTTGGSTTGGTNTGGSTTGGTNTGGSTTGGTNTGGSTTGIVTTGGGPTVLSSTAEFPDTGQIHNYTSATGEDGEISSLGGRSYTDNGKTISDNATGLMWEKVANFPSTRTPLKTHSDAVNFCGSLTTGGHTDWTLPSMHQLLTLFDYQQRPSINARFFNYSSWKVPNGNGGNYDLVAGTMDHWTSTPSTTNSGRYLAVPFGGRWNTTAQSTSNVLYTLCVRGASLAPSASTFTNNGNGTVTDSTTNLTWKIYNSSPSVLTWSNALAECNALTDNGGNWRLPSVNELLSIIDFSKTSPVVVSTSVFTDIGIADEFWTSTQDPMFISQSALAINFGNAELKSVVISGGTARTRCVKGG